MSVPRIRQLGPSSARNCLSLTATPVVSFSHHHNVLGKRLGLTLRTEKITFCPGSRTRRFLTSDRMKGTLEPSAPSIIPNPCTSIFFTIPVILSVRPVQPCSRSASRSALGWARDFSIHCSFPARGLSWHVCRINDRQKSSRLIQWTTMC